MSSGNEILVAVHDFFTSETTEIYFLLLSSQTAMITNQQAKIILSQGAMTLEAVRNLEKLIPEANYRGEGLYNQPVLLSALLLGMPQLGQLTQAKEIPDGMFFRGIAGDPYRRIGNRLVWQSKK